MTILGTNMKIKEYDEMLKYLTRSPQIKLPKEKNACNKNMQRMRERFELREGEAFGEYKLAYPLESYGDDGELLRGNEPWAPFNIRELNDTENMKQFELQQFGRLI